MIRLFAAAGRYSSALAPLAILGLIAAVYWPALSAGFVWDDNYFLHDSAWLSRDWANTVLHGFREWNAYYRPLGVALFAFEVHAFDLSPLPMHAVSLGIHLTNTLLVGVLARCLGAKVRPALSAAPLSYAAMLVFGLHPALIEPVTWIAAQYDLLLTLFTLCGLILNLKARHSLPRATGVALCFFLAACSKESALSFPFLLVITDWLCVGPDHQAESQNTTLRTQVLQLLRSQWAVYLATFLAGTAYLCCRRWGLGYLISQDPRLHWDGWQQLQVACFTYLRYWKLLIWPMNDLAPMHIMDGTLFTSFSLGLLAIDIASMTTVSIGLWLLMKRRPAGALIAAVSAAVLPAIHLIPFRFDDSLYHERYAMLAIAVACSLMPLLLDLDALKKRIRWVTPVLAAAATSWLILAVANARVTIPLWSNEVRLWEWALLKNPSSINVQQFLLSAYLQRNQIGNAQALAEIMMQGQGTACAECMLNIAGMNITLGHQEQATAALRQAKKALDELYPKPNLILTYILLSGELAELKHDFVEAEEAYRAAIAYEPLAPDGHMRLALLLARQHRLEEARDAASAALKLYAPDERPRRQREFDEAAASPLGHL
jgi:hypothetical protein